MTAEPVPGLLNNVAAYPSCELTKDYNAFEKSS